jgi:hypothetical protein
MAAMTSSIPLGRRQGGNFDLEGDPSKSKTAISDLALAGKRVAVGLGVHGEIGPLVASGRQLWLACAAWLPSHMRNRRGGVADMLWAAFPVVLALLLIGGLSLVVWMLASALHGQKVSSEISLQARQWESDSSGALRFRGYIPILVPVPHVGEPATSEHFQALRSALDAIGEVENLSDTVVVFAIDAESSRKNADELASLLPPSVPKAVFVRNSVITLQSATAPTAVTSASARVLFLLSAAFDSIEAPAAIILDPKPQGWRQTEVQRSEHRPRSHGHDPAPSRGTATLGPGDPLAVLPDDSGRLWISQDVLHFLKWMNREILRLKPSTAHSIMAVDACASTMVADLGSVRNLTRTDSVGQARSKQVPFIAAPTVDGSHLGWHRELKAREDKGIPNSFQAGFDGQVVMIMRHQWPHIAATWKHHREWRDGLVENALVSLKSVLAPFLPRCGRGTLPDANWQPLELSTQSSQSYQHQTALLKLGKESSPTVLALPK